MTTGTTFDSKLDLTNGVFFVLLFGKSLSWRLFYITFEVTVTVTGNSRLHSRRNVSKKLDVVDVV
jgi:hypothetical protein